MSDSFSSCSFNSDSFSTAYSSFPSFSSTLFPRPLLPHSPLLKPSTIWPSISSLLLEVEAVGVSSFTGFQTLLHSLYAVGPFAVNDKKKSRFQNVPIFFGSLPKDVSRLFFSSTIKVMASVVLRLPLLFNPPNSSSLSPSPSSSSSSSLDALLASSLPPFYTDLYTLPESHVCSMCLSASQCFALLCSAFFCILPSKTFVIPPASVSSSSSSAENCVISSSNCPGMNFHRFYLKRRQDQMGKFYAIICYLNSFASSLLERDFAEASRLIFFHRLQLRKPRSVEWWGLSTKPLKKPTLFGVGEKIEEADAIQADFANKSIGGAVLETGCVQEEIRFCISPELLVSLLLFEDLEASDSALIVGSRCFSRYEGYARTFACLGSKVDQTKRRIIEIEANEKLEEPINMKNTEKEEEEKMTKGGGGGGDSICNKQNRKWIRREVIESFVVAIDAENVQDNEKRQFGQLQMLREINKIATGLLFDDEKSIDLKRSCSSDVPSIMNKAFATGNWGCGAFGGDPQLKSLLQWLACAETGRPFHYYTFGHKDLLQLEKLTNEIIEQEWSVGKLWRCLINVRR